MHAHTEKLFDPDAGREYRPVVTDSFRAYTCHQVDDGLIMSIRFPHYHDPHHHHSFFSLFHGFVLVFRLLFLFCCMQQKE